MTSTRSSNDGEGPVPPTEVKPKAARRRFSAEYKREILAEADRCTGPATFGRPLNDSGPRTALEYHDLLAKGDVLKSESRSISKQRVDEREGGA